MAIHEPVQTVDAVVELRVPRGAMGDLPNGVRDVLAKVDAVRRVELDEVRGVRPDSFDLHVTAAARLDVAGEDPADVRRTLLSGFGIEAVEALTVEYG